jgi:DNA-binding transcriptional regulator YiaG
MNSMFHIRVNVFKVSQHEMAALAGVTQATVSKWEAGTHVPLSTALRNIRQAAIRRAIPWDDRWFFEQA